MSRRRSNRSAWVIRSSWRSRLLLRLVFLVIFPFVCLVWGINGLFSFNGLGRLLRSAGDDMERHDW